MSQIEIDKVKQLREKTGISVIACQKALKEAKGNLAEAEIILRANFKEMAAKKLERQPKTGIIDCYLHPGSKLGVMLELLCESDFVAKSSEFQKLAHELCLQIAAQNPLYLKTEDIPEDFLTEERRILEQSLQDKKLSPQEINQLIEEKLQARKEEICLLSQSWIKDETRKIQDLIAEKIALFGENIQIGRFARFQI